MMARSSSRGLWKRYGAMMRRDAHQLLAWGYADARTDISCTLSEVDITDLITRAINGRLSGTAPRRFDRYSVRDDVYRPASDRFGTRRRRVDILVENSEMRPRLFYVFEAKRLQRGSHPIGNYLGAEGLGRFIRGTYEETALEAGMIGYVQTPCVADWEVDLQNALSKKSTDLRIVRTLRRMRLTPDLEHSWESVHVREDAKEITICHILLDCCSTG